MITIKRAEVSDALAVTELGRRTFTETFAKDNTAEDLNHYLETTYHVQKQTQEIMDSKNMIEIAWDDKTAVGFVFLKNGDVDVSVSGEKPVELLRLYVDSFFHGKGVGAALMDRAITVAKSQGFMTLWLGVWEHNLKAQKFYKKYGFEKVGSHVFRLGSDDQTDFIFELKL